MAIANANPAAGRTQWSRVDGFSGDPVEVGRESMDNGDSENLGSSYGCRPDRRLDLGVAFGARFHGNRNFLRCFVWPRQ